MVTSDAATITKSDDVLAKLNTLEAAVIVYQSNIQAEIKALQIFNGLMAEYYNKTLSTIERYIREISFSDVVFREVLDAENETACIKNLKNFLDSIIELSGYAISNCIETKDNTSFVIPVDYLSKLYTLEKDVNSLSQIIINALIGHNIFTESSAIVARAVNQLEEKKEKFSATLTELTDASKGFSATFDFGIADLETCFNDILSSVGSGNYIIHSQLEICHKFGNARGGRGARSATLPNPKSLFPQLK